MPVFHQTRLFSVTNKGTNENEINRSQSKNKSGADDTNSADMNALAIQGGFVVVSAILVFSLLGAAFDATTSVATGAAGALGDETVREFGHLFSVLGSVLMALATGAGKFLTIVLPALFRGLYAAGQAAAPVVQQASHAVGDAASPFVDETSARISEAAAPYVDQVNSAVDSQIVTPALGAIDANVVVPLSKATSSATSVVDSTIKDATSSVASAVDSTVKSAADTVSSSVNAKINELNDVLTK